MMKRFIQGSDRSQATLFPERIEDYIADDNPVRAVDAFVDALDLGALGFGNVVPEATGRPGYHPATLLKIYVYGYLNQVQSSRRLERECRRNIELIWLTGRLVPDFKTIADFRKDYGPAISQTCRTFVEVCRRAGLLGSASVAIDGSKFKAVNGRDKNFTRAKMQRRFGEIDKSVARYLSQLESADRREAAGGAPIPEVKVMRLTEKIDVLRQEVERLKALEAEMLVSDDKQVSLTDPDARSMATSGRDTGIVGYNVQSAVDTKNHLIVAHEVTNVGPDRSQLSNMAEQARDALGVDELEVVADRGYYSGEEIAACEKAGIKVFLPKPMTSGSKLEGRFGKQDFAYIPEDNLYVCPAGEQLTKRFTTTEKGRPVDRYWTSACPGCQIKDQCTTGKERRISRWQHEDILDEVQSRMDRSPDKMRVRRQTVEHPFGTIKSWMGATHFQMKTLKHVPTEMALHVLAYNMKRAMTILGVDGLMAAVRS